MRVAIFTRNAGKSFPPTSYIRVILPLFHHSLKGRLAPQIIDHEQLHNKHPEALKNLLRPFHCVLVQRDCLNGAMATKVIAACKELKLRFIYEIDDNLLEISPTHPEYEQYKKKSQTIIRLIKHADKVVVSTDPLKQKVREYNPNVFVIENSLDEQLWINPLEKKFISASRKDQISIGYIGSYTHNADIEMIKIPYLRVKRWAFRMGIKMNFLLIGGTKESDSWFQRIHIPNSNYPEFVKWLRQNVAFDFGVAPLIDNELNFSKSPLKYLDYSALGIPGIYSNVLPYKKVINHKKNGMLVNNRIDEWEKAMKELTEDCQLRENMKNHAYKDVTENYLLQKTCVKWLNIFV